MPNLPLGPGAEFDRIRAIAAALGQRAAALGDDCAVLAPVAGRVVLSTDLSVEGVHFRREWLTPLEIGWRAAASALSDLAAEGAEPIGLLAAVGAPTEFGEGELTELMRGVGEAAEAAGGKVLGGDLSSAANLVVAITVVGMTARPVTRAGALPGDGLWLTGALGAARAALVAWQEGRQPEPEARVSFVRPVPRIREGRWLAEHGARAMLDISDGLGGDARHLAAASAVGLEVNLDAVPVGPGVVAAASRAAIAPALFAALGGEDYELLAALPPEFGEDDAHAFQQATGLALTRIGRVRQGAGVEFRLAGAVVAPVGYSHFA